MSLSGTIELFKSSIACAKELKQRTICRSDEKVWSNIMEIPVYTRIYLKII